jgi:multisubunit Na+/H+ antiporter MnhC subunit
MDADKTLRSELLKQENPEERQRADAELKTIHEKIALDETRIRRLKWVTALAWAVALLPLLAGSLTRLITPGLAASLTERFSSSAADPIVVILVIIMIGAWYCAVAMTIALLLRTWGASRRQMQVTLLGIQEELKRISRERQQ